MPPAVGPAVPRSRPTPQNASARVIVLRVAQSLPGSVIGELPLLGPLRQVLDRCRSVPMLYHVIEELFVLKRVVRYGAEREGTIRRHACGQARGLRNDRGSLLVGELGQEGQPAIEQAFCLGLVDFRYDARDPE